MERFFSTKITLDTGGHEINRLSTWGSVVIFVFLLMVAFLFGWWFLFSFFGISFLLLIGFFIFFPLIIFYRAILSIKIILGYGPKKFIASKRNITDATSNTLAVYRLKINRNKEIT